jgi:ankyrin repeat protein
MPNATPSVTSYFAACAAGDTGTLRTLLAADPTLAQQTDARGATGLHHAVDYPEALRLLVQHGADPNVRETGDNALALHFAVGRAPLDSVRVLLDAGSDVQGAGDAHRLDVIGWATCFEEARRDVVDVLVARGAKHHVFSAIALGDLHLVRRVVESDPSALRRRLASTEQEQTPLHYVIAPPDGLVGGRFRTGEHYRTLALLIELGADLEARDAKGRTPLEVAMLMGDREAMRLLHAAGAKEPELPDGPRRPSTPDGAGTIGKVTPMLAAPDMNATLGWYRAIGFEVSETDGTEPPGWALAKLGQAEIMFVPGGATMRGLSLWIRTDRLDDLYATLKRRQLEHARAVLRGAESDGVEIPFTLDLWTAFYGQREFGIRDPNGVELMFTQPVEPTGSAAEAT